MLLDAESFNGFVTAQLPFRFTQITDEGNANPGLSITANGPRSNYCLKTTISGGNGSFARYAASAHMVVPASGSRFIQCFRWKFPTIDFTFSGLQQGTSSLGGNNVLRIAHLGTAQCWARINVDGTISFFREGLTTPLVTSVGLALSMDTWYTFEWQVDIDNTVGAVLLKVNGVTFLNATGLDTQNLATAVWSEYTTPRLAVGSGAVSTVWYVADLVVADGVTGSSGVHGVGNDGWTTIRGGVQVNPCYTVAEGFHVGSTPSTGADREDMIDEGSTTGGTGPDSDTTYNTLAGIGTKESFTHSPTPDPTATILGVVHKAFVQLSATGTGLLKLGSRVGGTDYMGIDLGVPSTYAYRMSAEGVNPATGDTWSAAAFDASEYVDEKTA